MLVTWYEQWVPGSKKQSRLPTRARAPGCGNAHASLSSSKVRLAFNRPCQQSSEVLETHVLEAAIPAPPDEGSQGPPRATSLFGGGNAVSADNKEINKFARLFNYLLRKRDYRY